MGFNRNSRLRDLCAHTEEDDGLDPRYDDKDTASRTKNFARKDEQLAKAARRFIEQHLSAGGFATPELRLVDVEVRGGGTHIHARIASPISIANRSQLETELAALSKRVRASLAHAFNRKKTPTVTLRLCDWMPTPDHQGHRS